MRESRLPHPPGGRFLILHDWAVRILGRAGAAVLGVIDFLDRREETPGAWVASRARIVADLEGFVGRNAVDEALEDLVHRGWLRRKNYVEQGSKNLIRRVQFSLDADAVSKFFAVDADGKVKSDLPKSGFPTSRNRETGNPDFGTDSGTYMGTPYIRKDIDQTTTTTVTSPGDGVAPEGAGGGGPLDIDPGYLEELVEAGVMAARKIDFPIPFKRAMRQRILSQGPSVDDIAALAEYRRRLDAARAQAAKAEAERLREERARTPEARAADRDHIAALRAMLPRSRPIPRR